MQDPNSNQQNADTRASDAFASPDGPQQTDKASVTHNLDTGEIEPLRKPTDDDGVDDMEFGIGSDGGSAGDGGAA